MATLSPDSSWPPLLRKFDLARATLNIYVHTPFSGRLFLTCCRLDALHTLSNAADLNINSHPPTRRATSPPRLDIHAVFAPCASSPYAELPHRAAAHSLPLHPPALSSLRTLTVGSCSRVLQSLPYPLRAHTSRTRIPSSSRTPHPTALRVEFASAHSPRLVSFPTLISALVYTTARAVESSRCHPPSARTRIRRELARRVRGVCFESLRTTAAPQFVHAGARARVQFPLAAASRGIGIRRRPFPPPRHFLSSAPFRSILRTPSRSY
ncbi:hypothetical protein B0H16DRAFT_1894953 [Mycena metata]|uniref:Uncharacterized protein n=1 Tax=Mycena metata TaxID=1033252 RepID=A0AAD7HRU1_9AGAR|nr:hypothetical protein B0H16DRAFT_1894953 [Mycena metata]